MEYYAKVEGNISTKKVKLEGDISMGRGGGTDLPIDYENDKHIINRPQINNVELLGNKTSKQLKLQDEMEAMTVQEIEKILYLD